MVDNSPVRTHVGHIMRRINKALAPYGLSIVYDRRHDQRDYFIIALDGSLPRQGPVYFDELGAIANQLDALTKLERAYGVIVVTPKRDYEQLAAPRFGPVTLPTITYAPARLTAVQSRIEQASPAPSGPSEADMDDYEDQAKIPA